MKASIEAVPTHLIWHGQQGLPSSYLAADELHRLYKAATDATERTHLQIIWLLSSGRSAQFVPEVTGSTPLWVSVIVGRYNEAEVAELGDQRQFNPGARPLLDASQQRRLRDSLDDPPPDRGLWTGRSVAHWIAGVLGRLVSPRRGTEYLGRLGSTRQVPRPRHAEADPLVQEGFKTRFRRRVQALQHEAPPRRWRCGRWPSTASGSNRRSAGCGRRTAAVP